MRYTMMSYTMSRQPGFDIPAMLRLTTELRLDGIDFVSLHDRTAGDLRKMADDAGIPVVCYTFWPDLNHATAVERAPGLDAFRQGIEAAVTLGAPTIMAVFGGKEGIDRGTSRQNIIAGLRDAIPVAERTGITVTVENMHGADSPFVTAADFMEAAEAIPGLRLTYDNGNAATGEDPARSFTACAGRVAHAHFKDWEISTTPKDGFTRMLDGRFYRPALIGEGDIDQRACLQAMRAAGYSGCINIEYEGERYAAAEAVRRAVDHLRSAA